MKDIPSNTNSACVMNFFTHSHGYCLFPRMTLSLHENLQTVPNRTHAQTAISKYERRGWHSVQVTTDQACSTGLRHCDDSLSWKIKRSHFSDLPNSDPADIGSWLMMTDNIWSPHKVFFAVFEQKTLTYSYVITNIWFALAMKESLGTSFNIIQNLKHSDGLAERYVFIFNSCPLLIFFCLG